MASCCLRLRAEPWLLVAEEGACENKRQGGAGAKPQVPPGSEPARAAAWGWPAIGRCTERSGDRAMHQPQAFGQRLRA
jgi:hypothetical protein